MTELRTEDEHLKRLRVLAGSSIVGGDIKWLLDEYDRLIRHSLRRREALSMELHVALEEWRDARAPTERVVRAVSDLVQHGIDFVIAEFDGDAT